METELEHLLMNSHKGEMIAHMAAYPEDFDHAIKFAISNKQPYAWRAAWLLWSCMDKNDQRVQKFIEEIIESLKNKDPNHQRELIKILYLMELSEEHQGFLFDICLTNWKKIDNKPSVRYIAFKMMVKIAKEHSDLANEITLLTQNEYLDSLSSAAQKSINKMAKEMTYI